MALGVLMLLVSVGDVVFTLLNVAKYGIESEANPVARFMVGGGQLMTGLWIMLNIMSTMLIYILLVSFYLMEPLQKREGRAATLISMVLAARMTVVLYGYAVLSYSAVEASSALFAIGVVLMLSIRFIMRHGENTSLADIKMSLGNFAASVKSSVVRFFSAIAAYPSAIIKAWKQRRVDFKLSDRNLLKDQQGRGEEADVEIAERRRPKRIVIIVASLVAVPIVALGALQVVKDVSGIEDLPRFLMQGGTPEQGGIQGTVFLIGFAISIAVVGIMVYLIFSLFEELSRGRIDV
jgi:hypothetical protein